MLRNHHIINKAPDMSDPGKQGKDAGETLRLMMTAIPLASLAVAREGNRSIVLWSVSHILGGFANGSRTRSESGKPKTLPGKTLDLFWGKQKKEAKYPWKTTKKN